MKKFSLILIFSVVTALVVLGLAHWKMSHDTCEAAGGVLVRKVAPAYRFHCVKAENFIW